ncbi:MAG: ABC transporter permease subunit [Oscillospiraceae bacterium]|nr:ABC transporter permease subunit [Oscillospiraceae bacterium]
MRLAYEQRQLLVLCIPFLLFVLVFNYLPVVGWTMAFQNFSPAKGIFGSDFVGMANFVEAFNDTNFLNAIRNTLSTSFLKIIFSFFSAILLAVMLNEVRIIAFKRTVQTISYLPYFVSWVVASNIVYMVLSPSDGIINILLMKMGLISEGVPFMGEPKYFYMIIALSNVWKNVGWNAIIYLSAMTGIDQELYEAAAVDGAGRIRRILAVTIPCIMPTIKIMLVLQIGHLMNAGFEHVYLLSNPSNISASRTIDVYVYTYAMKGGRLSYGTAIGIFNSTVSIALIMISNWVSKKIDGYGIF